MKKLNVIGGGIILLAVIAGIWWSTTSSDRSSGDIGTSALPSSQSIIVPELSPVALTGEATFNASCASCHGTNAAGTEQGPPLIHKFYTSRRHADFAFVIAAKTGVRAHHWRFGSMPPVEGIEDAEIQPIITYIREIQAANGL